MRMTTTQMSDLQKIVAGRLELEHPKWFYANATYVTRRDALACFDQACLPPIHPS